MKIWHIFFFFSIIVVIMTAVPAVRTYMLAKQSGILAVKPYHAPGWLPRQIVSLLVGSVIFLGFSLQATGNQVFSIDSMEAFQEMLTKNQMLLGVEFCAILACHLSSAVKMFGFLTQNGWYRIAADKPVALKAQEHENKLWFLPVLDDTAQAGQKPLLVFADTPENRERFTAFM